MMMSYIAFKSLRICSDGLYSPQRNTKWDEVYVPSLGRLTYSLSASSLEGEQGIYAATFGDALRYMNEDCRMFLVTPDPDAETEIGTRGWRTTCAIVLSEVDLHDTASLHDAAGLILASHQAGYPQVNDILRWARFVLAPRTGLTVRELVEQSVEVRRMIRAAAYATIRIVCSDHTVSVTESTPIRIVAGDKRPVLVGQPCLKTHFRRGRFERTLSTTLHIEVGEDWPPLKSLCQTS